MCRFDSQSDRLHKLMESRDEEAASLRADVAAVKEELQQARATLADTSDKDKAERLESELSDIRANLKEKEAAIVQVSFATRSRTPSHGSGLAACSMLQSISTESATVLSHP